MTKMKEDPPDTRSEPEAGSSETTRNPREPEPRWPARLKELSQDLRSPRDQSSQDRARGEAWLLLGSALHRYLRSHAARYGQVSWEDMEDIAAEKSLDLLRKMELEKWEVWNKPPSKVKAYISTVARNGLCDRLKEMGRRVEPADEEQPEWEVGQAGLGPPTSSTDPPDVRVERNEFVEALRKCVEQLKSRSRLVWFLRVFYEMPSRKIAVHPAVRLKTNHVDVILQRSRQKVGECMGRQGFDVGDMPPGSFAEMWRTFPLEWPLVIHGGAK
jgi:RNA polymerase sigma factor (sigma-70 family)